MIKFLERTEYKNNSILLENRNTSITDRTKPEIFKGNVIRLKIQYFEAELIFKNDRCFTFKEKPLIKGYSNPIYRIINYDYGNKIRDYTLKDENQFFPNYFYKYDNKNRLTEIVFPYKHDGSPFRKYSFNYNKMDQLIQKKFLRGDKRNGWVDKYKYDEEGKVISEIWENDSSCIMFKLKYNARNKIIRKTGQLTKKVKKMISGNFGFNAFFYVYQPNKEILFDMKIEYFENDKIQNIVINNAELESFGFEETDQTELFNYTSNGDKIINRTRTTESFGTQKSKTVFNKNDEIVCYDDYTYGEFYKWTYEYDDRLNWVKCIQYIDNKPILIIKRTLSY